MMTMDGCRGGDLVAPMSSRYLSHQPKTRCPSSVMAAEREGRMDAIRGHWQQEAQFQEQPTGPIREARPGGWTLVPSRTGPFAAFAGTPPPSPAMRWPSVLGNLGDGGGGWGISWQKLDDRITVDDEHENEGFLSEHG